MTINKRLEKSLNEINNHEQHGDLKSHNSIRIIDEVIYVLGNICGLAIYKPDKEDTNYYLAVLLGEDDDYWFIREDLCTFDVHWIPDYADVMQRAKDYLMINYNIDFTRDEIN